MTRKSTAYSPASEDSDAEFKVPLTPASTRVPTPSTPVPPIPKAYTNFGISATAGVTTSLLLYLLDAASDAVLVWSFWNETEDANIYYISEVWEKRLSVTLGIIIIPAVLVNIISLSLYGRMEKRSENEQVLYHEGWLRKALCVVLHVCLLGMLVRYMDLIKCGRNLLRGKKREMNPQKRRVLSLEGNQRLQEILEEKAYIKRLTKESNLVDLLYNHFKNSTQLVYQIFLIYRSRIVFNTDVLHWKITVAIQLIKVFVCLCCVTWSHVNFQEEIRRKDLEVKQLRVSSIFLCCIWRASMLGSRVLSLASFAALRATPEGGLIKVDHYGDGRNLPLSFQAMMAIFLAVHWFVMLIWIHSQRSNWCSRRNSANREECCEFLFSMAIAWVHNFCYLNLKDSLVRKRMIFFYVLIFLENTALMILFYFQLITVVTWLRVAVILLVEFLMLVGLSCAIGYHAFVDPSTKKSNSIS